MKISILLLLFFSFCFADNLKRYGETSGCVPSYHEQALNTLLDLELVNPSPWRSLFNSTCGSCIPRSPIPINRNQTNFLRTYMLNCSQTFTGTRCGASQPFLNTNSVPFFRNTTLLSVLDFFGQMLRETFPITAWNGFSKAANSTRALSIRFVPQPGGTILQHVIGAELGLNATIPEVTSGVHIAINSTHFVFYVIARVNATGAQLVLNGSPYSMAPFINSSFGCSFQSQPFAISGCQQYYFNVSLPTGGFRRYPDTGTFETFSDPVYGNSCQTFFTGESCTPQVPQTTAIFTTDQVTTALPQQTTSQATTEQQITTEQQFTTGEPLTTLSQGPLTGTVQPVQSSQKASSIIPIIVGVVVGGVIVIVVIILIVFFVTRRKSTSDSSPASQMPSRAPIARSDSRMSLYDELQTETNIRVLNIVIRERLGGGKFGDVYRGMWNDSTVVALKKLKEKSKKDEFEAEITVLREMRHPNIVQFLGVYIDKEGDYYMVTEFMSKGSLTTLLQMEGPTLGVLSLVTMALSIASGMQYLESLKVVHRDLSCRNCLVKEEDRVYVVKLADFGLSKFTQDGSISSQDLSLPIRWTAIEAIQNKTFSSKTDCWSFGVTLWELFSYGKVPYEEWSNQRVADEVAKGYRLPKPNECPSEIYDIVLKCWNSNPAQRPSFLTIYQGIKQVYMTMKVGDTNPNHHRVLVASGTWNSPSNEGGAFYDENSQTNQTGGAFYDENTQTNQDGGAFYDENSPRPPPPKQPQSSNAIGLRQTN